MTKLKKSILPAGWQIPEELRNRLGDEAGRQRVMESDGHLLLVLHEPPEPDHLPRVGRFLWRKPDGTWAASGGASGPAALSALLDEYDQSIRKATEMEAGANDSEDYFAVLSLLSPLARSTRNLYQTLQEARKAEKSDRRLILARDRAYAMHRQCELLETDSRNALNFAIARKAEEQARSSHQMATAAHRLNLLVAFFFPIATLCAIFSTNFRHGLREMDDSLRPFPLVALLVLGLFLGTLLTLFVTRYSPTRKNKSE